MSIRDADVDSNVDVDADVDGERKSPVESRTVSGQCRVV